MTFIEMLLTFEPHRLTMPSDWINTFPHLSCSAHPLVLRSSQSTTMDSNVNAAIEVLRSCRKVYDAEHQHLSPEQRESGWSLHWAAIQSAMTGSASSFQLGSSVPQKRSASSAMLIGMEPASKRGGHVCTLVMLPSCLV